MGIRIMKSDPLLQMFKKKYRPKYYYDIERTKKESYRHSWQLLHQVSGANESTSDASIPQPNSLDFININLWVKIADTTATTISKHYYANVY